MSRLNYSTFDAFCFREKTDFSKNRVCVLGMISCFSLCVFPEIIYILLAFYKFYQKISFFIVSPPNGPHKKCFQNMILCIFCPKPLWLANLQIFDFRRFFILITVNPFSTRFKKSVRFEKYPVTRRTQAEYRNRPTDDYHVIEYHAGVLSILL